MTELKDVEAEPRGRRHRAGRADGGVRGARAARGRDARRRGVRPRADAGGDPGDQRARREAGKPAWELAAAAEERIAHRARRASSPRATCARRSASSRSRRATRGSTRSARASPSELAEEAQQIGVEIDPHELKEIFFNLESKIVRGQILDGEPRIDGRDTRTVRPITIARRRAAARPRLGAVHPRRNPGAGDRDARHRARRADHRRACRASTASAS